MRKSLGVSFQKLAVQGLRSATLRTLSNISTPRSTKNSYRRYRLSWQTCSLELPPLTAGSLRDILHGTRGSDAGKEHAEESKRPTGIRTFEKDSDQEDDTIDEDDAPSTCNGNGAACLNSKSEVALLPDFTMNASSRMALCHHPQNLTFSTASSVHLAVTKSLSQLCPRSQRPQI